MEDENITIAIDGYSSSGKSTLARDLAHTLHYIHIDSGSMYRAVTWYLHQKDLLPPSTEKISEVLQNITITFQPQNGEHILMLENRPMDNELRSRPVNEWVSQVAAISTIRKHLVEIQRSLGNDVGIVMDGRDIGTVVFPDAELKFFLTSDFEVRVNRRWKQLRERDVETSKKEVAANLRERDEIDTNRSDSPLRKSDEAIILDTTALSRTDQLNEALIYCRKLIEINP